MRTPENDLEMPGEPLDCSGARALAREALIALGEETLPPAAEAHAGGCARCRRDFGDLARVGGLVGESLGSLRHGIAGPSTERMDGILASVAGPPETSLLLRRIRRSVNRMLWLTLLVLALLPLAGLLRWLLTLLGRVQGH